MSAAGGRRVQARMFGGGGGASVAARNVRARSHFARHQKKPRRRNCFAYMRAALLRDSFKIQVRRRNYLRPRLLGHHRAPALYALAKTAVFRRARGYGGLVFIGLRRAASGADYRAFDSVEARQKTPLYERVLRRRLRLGGGQPDVVLRKSFQGVRAEGLA